MASVRDPANAIARALSRTRTSVSAPEVQPIQSLIRKPSIGT